MNLKLISEILQCDVYMEERKELYNCGNSISQNETECQYKMCKFCLNDIKLSLDNRCPQCRNDIITIPNKTVLEIVKMYYKRCKIDYTPCVKNMGNVCFCFSGVIFFCIFISDIFKN